MQNYIEYMQICETIAQAAASKGNSPVGSLIIVKDEIVAMAEEAVTEKQDVSCHAEMEAIRKARKTIGKDMSDAILITTKEPCVMCSYAIRYHKISVVVYQEKAEALGGANSGFNLLISDEVPSTWGPPVNCIQLNN